MTEPISKTKPAGQERSASHKAFRRFMRNPLSITGLLLVIILIVIAILAPAIAPHDPSQQNLFDKRSKPFGKYILGADLFGRDILSRLIYGARASIFVACFSVLIALVGGMFIGTICGYWGGLIDSVLMRLMDLMLSFPYLLLAILFVAALGPGIVNTTLAIGIWALPTFQTATATRTARTRQSNPSPERCAP